MNIEEFLADNYSDVLDEYYTMMHAKKPKVGEYVRAKKDTELLVAGAVYEVIESNDDMVTLKDEATAIKISSFRWGDKVQKVKRVWEVFW